MSIYQLNSLSNPKDKQIVREAISSLLKENQNINYQVHLLLDEPTQEVKQDLNSIVIQGEYGAVAQIISPMIDEYNNLSLDLTNVEKYIQVRHTLICQAKE